MFDEISDARLHSFMRKWIDANDQSLKTKLASVYFCGYSPLKIPILSDNLGVYIVANDVEASTFGTTHCNSVWACPKCEAKVMSAYGERIACAIEALRKKHLSAMMFTLTIPHMSFMSCHDSYEVLQKAWRKFTHSYKKQQKRTYKRKDGRETTYYVNNNQACKFMNELDIKHCVRVYEVTWGKHSFHPHIHGLWWTHDKNWHKIPDYEEKLHIFWFRCIEIAARAYWKDKLKDEEKANKLVDELCAEWRKYPTTGYRAFYLSKNPDGSIRKAKSSYYIVGWSADKEIAQLSRKQAHEDHLTPHQILHKAFLSDNPEEVNKLMKIYFEYALETKGHCRVCFSPGLNQIVEQWKKTNQYMQMLKKRLTDKAEHCGKRRVVAWFSKQQWLHLCYLDSLEYNHHVIANILDMARAPNANELIELYCMQLGVDISSNIIANKEWVLKCICS